MKPLTLLEIRQAVGGRALTPVPVGIPPVKVVCTDTRNLPAGCLFFALRGEKHDGHAYLTQAASAGAAGAIVEHAPAVPIPGLHLIGVADSRAAMGRLASFV